MDPNPTTPLPDEEPKTPETTPTTESAPDETPAEAPATEPVAEPAPAAEPQPAPEPTPAPEPQPAPAPVAQPIDMATVQNPATAATTAAPAPEKKKSHTGLIIAIVLIVVLGLPILGFIIFTVFIVGLASTLDEGDIQEIENTINEIQEETEEGTKKPTNNVKNVVAGDWNCVNGATGTNDPTKFYTTIKLNKDMTFKYGPYGDLEDNHFSGTYTYEDEHKENNSGEYSYYIVFFDTEEGVVEGKKQTIDTSNSLSDMEIGIAEGDDGKEAITIFTSSGNMYYCYDYSNQKTK